MDGGVREWLCVNLASELDLRNPSRNRGGREGKASHSPHVIAMVDDNPAAYGELSRRGGVVELHTVLVDPSQRGKGWSHRAVTEARERWRQDIILNGIALPEPIGLEEAISSSSRAEVEEAEQRGVNLGERGAVSEVLDERGLDLVCFTRSPALAASLHAAGFRMAPQRRRWWTLWLKRHGWGALSTRSATALLLHRIGRGIWMFLRGDPLPNGTKRRNFVTRFFQRRRRLFHQLSHLGDYNLFILTRVADREHPNPPCLVEGDEESSDELSRMGMRIITPNEVVAALKEGSSDEEVAGWDEGNDGAGQSIADINE